MRYFEISLSYTLKCNAYCAHCCVNAGPSQNKKISIGNAKKLISDAKRYGIKFIAFTGGEPTLFRKELLEIMKFSKANKIKNILVTNAWWAKTVKTSEAFVKQLKKAGVIEIQISTDVFHTAFIPFDNIINAIKAIKKYRIKPVVMFTRIKNDKETVELINKTKKFKIKIIEQPVVPFNGRSKNLPKTFLYRLPLKKMRYVGCISVLSPTISPDLILYACCASDFSFIKDSALFLGNLKKQSLYKLLKQNENNRILDILYLWGPKFIFDLVKRKRSFLVKNFPKEYYGYCDLCYRICKNKAIINFLKSELKKKEFIKKIEIAKLIKYNKIKNMKNKEHPWYECVIEREYG
jgi:MoaA/NifB/PqqE/SkfB family radical SAM enzyme